MWFVILKTLLPEDPGAWSAQPGMLLVADDANAAYSNPRPLPKCAQTLPPLFPKPTAPVDVRMPLPRDLKKHIQAC
jgi:hypothetical protein